MFINLSLRLVVGFALELDRFFTVAQIHLDSVLNVVCSHYIFLKIGLLHSEPGSKSICFKIKFQRSCFKFFFVQEYSSPQRYQKCAIVHGRQFRTYYLALEQRPENVRLVHVLVRNLLSHD